VPADADIAPACEAAGLFRMGDSPGMVLERRLPDATPPPGVTIRTVETDADGAEFARVNGAAYATYGMANDVTPAILGRLDVMRAPHITSVLAYVDGVAMAAAMVMLTHGIGGVYWVGTTPSARGKGLAALCTRVVGNVAFDAGARVGRAAGVDHGRADLPRDGVSRGDAVPVLRADDAAGGVSLSGRASTSRSSSACRLLRGSSGT
jgi:hypothetical protein